MVFKTQLLNSRNAVKTARSASVLSIGKRQTERQRGREAESETEEGQIVP